jgi:hypothetical protein
MRLLLGSAVLAAAAGCDPGPRYHVVTGTVTLDGRPLEAGDILFADPGGAAGPDPGKVKDGAFEFRAKEGRRRVEISASRIIPGSKTRGAGGEPVPEEVVPDRYNVASELTAEVAPGGPNRFEFKLTTNKK